jgi:hypothetical protein
MSMTQKSLRIYGSFSENQVKTLKSTVANLLILQEKGNCLLASYA